MKPMTRNESVVYYSVNNAVARSRPMGRLVWAWGQEDGMNDLTKLAPNLARCQRRRSTKLIIAVLLTLPAGTVLADAIDGNWCHSDGRRFTIRGADIVTPGGKAMQGDYSRHYFSYVVPAPEQGAGSTIYMTLMGENAVQLRYGDAASANPENWVRCSPSISAVRSPTRS